MLRGVYMVFSSPLFIFLFLPLVITIYYTIRKELRNIFLLIASLLFYAWGEPLYVFLMIVSILMNYAFGMIIENYRKERMVCKSTLIIGVVANIGLLGFFKYANFFVSNLNGLANMFGMKGITHWTPIPLPIGISFFTFQALSYVIDVYRRETEVQKSPLDLGLYVALFPQLIAGPIVRYHDIAKEIYSRQASIDEAAAGIKRFIIGFGKKIIIANTLGQVADNIFSIPQGNLNIGVAWLGIICYTLQIYYDFSGYSDMAIGLGKLFGFTFLENFNYPYISKSIKEFWTRWHISLSTWFRDYLYIPLGGSRCSPVRTYMNQIIVFLLSGLWHGASWNFVIWGAYHGLFLTIERAGFGKVLDRIWKPLRHTYAILVVVIGWVFFRSENLSYSLSYIKAMFGLFNYTTNEYYLAQYLNNKVLLILLLGIVLSTPIFGVLDRSFKNLRESNNAFNYVEYSIIFIVFILSLMSLASSTYNPFIYFRF
jgi:alginate O-acetyltransferase complex protein AlgI